MIRADPVELTEAEDRQLRDWLNAGPITLLQRVAEARCKEAECKCLADALDAKEPNKKIESGNEHLRQAQKWAYFLEKLAEISKHQGRFTVVRLT